MSHFTVLVIGEDYEQQLAPYDEEIQVAPYRDYADESDMKMYRRVYREEHDGADPPSDEELAAFMAEHWEEKIAADEKGIYRLSTYNPNSKWDWYSVGGRWRGYFKIKPGVAVGTSQVGRAGAFDNEPENDADVVRKGEVDVEAMRQKQGERAAARYDLAAQILEGLPPAEPWSKFYEETRKAIEALGDNPDTEVVKQAWNDTRRDYAAQPAVKAFRERGKGEDDILGWDADPDIYQRMTREEYIQSWRDRALATYAYVKDGEWFAPGRMGWWGMSSEGEDEKEQFIRHFNEMFDELPDDTLLTLVDCHI